MDERLKEVTKKRKDLDVELEEAHQTVKGVINELLGTWGRRWMPMVDEHTYVKKELNTIKS